MEVSVERLEDLISEVSLLRAEVDTLKGEVNSIMQEICDDGTENKPSCLNSSLPIALVSRAKKTERELQNVCVRSLLLKLFTYDLDGGSSENKSTINDNQDNLVTRVRRLEHELFFDVWDYKNHEERLKNGQLFNVTAYEEYEQKQDVRSYLDGSTYETKTVGYLFRKLLCENGLQGLDERVTAEIQRLLAEQPIATEMKNIIVEAATQALVKQFAAERAIGIFKEYWRKQQEEFKTFKKQHENEITKITEKIQNKAMDYDRSAGASLDKIKRYIEAINGLSEELKFEKVLIDEKHF